MNSKRIVAFGEIIWDILPTGRVLGGAPANFAARLQSLGHRVSLVSRVGQDQLGLEALTQLERHGIDLGLVGLDDQHPTGTATVSVQSDGTPVFQIQPEVAYDYIPLTTETINQVRSSDYFCFGTLSQRSLVSRETLVSLLADYQGVRVLDLNLRKDCFERSTILQSLRCADILKLNADEAHYLRTLLNWSMVNNLQLSKQILQEFGLEVCLITLGGEGVIAVSQEQPALYVPGFEVEVMDTCGSGDAFTAAFLDSYSRGEALLQSCRVGNALGALVAATHGATVPISDSQIQSLLRSPQPC